MGAEGRGAWTLGRDGALGRKLGVEGMLGRKLGLDGALGRKLGGDWNVGACDGGMYRGAGALGGLYVGARGNAEGGATYCGRGDEGTLTGGLEGVGYAGMFGAARYGCCGYAFAGGRYGVFCAGGTPRYPRTPGE
jgi:hypothetical protein